MSVFSVGPWRLHLTNLVLYTALLCSYTVEMVEVTIGILGPWDTPGSHVYPLLGSRTAGAVPLAIEQVRNDGILGNHTLAFVYRDTKCDSRRASGSAVDLHLISGVHAFIGPPCSESCRSVKDLTAYWGSPFISWFCPETAPAVADDIYEAFARTFVPFSSICRLPGAVMAEYGWTAASVIYALSQPWQSLAETVLYRMINTGITILSVQGYERPLDVKRAMSLLQTVKNVSHVIWLFIGGITTLEEDEQIFMLAAAQLDMTGGAQVFLRFEVFPDPGYNTPWIPVLVDGNATTDKEIPSEDSLKDAYEALLVITHRLPQDGRIEQLLARIPDALEDPAFGFHTIPNSTSPRASIMAAFLYDSVLLFAHATRQHVENKGFVAGNYTKTNVTFEGMTGHVLLDGAGDRIANFSVLDLKNGERFQAVGHVSGTQPEFEPIAGQEVWWPGSAIPREPKCGYRNEKCLDSSIITAIVVGGIMTLVLIIAIPYLSLKYRKYISRRDWLIEMDELTFLPLQNSTIGVGLQAYPSTYRLPNLSERLLSQQSLVDQSVQDRLRKQSELIPPDLSLAKYKSETVVLRKAKISNSLTLNKATKKELKEMRMMVHGNLNRFVGVCFPTRGDNNIFYYISEYCPKGNLKSVLANDDIKLDLSFKVSFINDLARGMQFLHNSVVKSHGLLCSNLCFIDSRWALKIAGFGTVSFHMSRGTGQKIADPEHRFSKLLWTSPELLRLELPTKGSQKGDVYSFGILIEEILTRSTPYQDAGLSSREIIRRVMKRQEPPFRPHMTLSDDEVSSVHFSQSGGIVSCLTELMTQCWQELPADRPDFHTIRQRLRTMQRGRKELNLMDNMVSKMEKYTENLEQVVADRTGQLLEEKKKTDALLYRMLPQAVADELKKGQSFHGEFYEQVTLYFSDIVGFTEISAMSSPMEVVDLLNDLYTCFDAILETFDVYKVETIGDAYMVASGLPHRNGNRHASEIASMALAVREGVKTFRVRHLPEHQLQIRIGINSGPVAAGVVGLTMPRFCLFGDTVNTASRMESHGMPQRIHISWSTATLLTSIGGYRLEVRGQMKIKGKGVMTTFWLFGTDEQYSALQIHNSSQNNSIKKISTDTVISEDSLLSPPNNSDQQDVIQDSLIASRVPEEFPSEFSSEASSIASSPQRRRMGNTYENRDFAQRKRNSITMETCKAPSTEQNSNASTAQGSSDITAKTDDATAKTGDKTTRTDDLTTQTNDLNTKTDDLNIKTDDAQTKSDDLSTKLNGITSMSDDVVAQDGNFVRTESGDVIRTPGGDVIRTPSKKHSHRLSSLQEAAVDLPNVPSLPDIQVHNEELSNEGRPSKSIFSYTVPLPHLMNEITSTAVMESSVHMLDFDQQNNSQ